MKIWSKKVLFWISSILLGLFVFLLVSLLIANRIINHPSYKKKIQARISESIGGEVKYGRIHLLLFPTPSIVAQEAAVLIKNHVRSTIDELKFYFQLGPLLWGKLHVKNVTVKKPSVILSFPEKISETAGEDAPFWLKQVGENLQDILRFLDSAMPKGIARVAEGHLEVRQKGEKRIGFDAVEAVLAMTSTGAELNIGSVSNWAEKIRLSTAVDLKSKSMEGTVDVGNGMLDLDVVVAPMKTANVIVRHIPLLGYVLGGTAVGIPVKITGDLRNSKIISLHPRLVGSRLLNVLRRTAKIPLEMLNIK